jgi:hypothetical protein
MGAKLDLFLTPTQSAFAESDALINVIYGSAGEGKTYAAVGAMVINAQRNKRPVLWALFVIPTQISRDQQSGPSTRFFAKPRSYLMARR